MAAPKRKPPAGGIGTPATGRPAKVVKGFQAAPGYPRDINGNLKKIGSKRTNPVSTRASNIVKAEMAPKPGFLNKPKVR